MFAILAIHVCNLPSTVPARHRFRPGAKRLGGANAAFVTGIGFPFPVRNPRPSLVGMARYDAPPGIVVAPAGRGKERFGAPPWVGGPPSFQFSPPCHVRCHMVDSGGSRGRFPDLLPYLVWRGCRCPAGYGSRVPGPIRVCTGGKRAKTRRPIRNRRLPGIQRQALYKK